MSNNISESTNCSNPFNAGWNDANKVEWIDGLTDCEIEYIDIAKNKTTTRISSGGCTHYRNPSV